MRGLAALAVDCDESAVDRLMTYIGELEKWNPAYGLVNAEGDDLVIKHILDSLSPFRIIESLLAEFDARAGAEAAPSAAPSGALDARAGPGDAAKVGKAVAGNKSLPPAGATVSDLGSGAGLPGIPLSIVFPQRKFLLYERMDRRVRFLETQKLLLGLSNVEICCAETSHPPRPYDIAVFRAFRPFSDIKLFRAIWKNTKTGGALVAYKGKILNASLELERLREDPAFSGGAAAADILPVWVPFLEEERCVTVLQKRRG